MPRVGGPHIGESRPNTSAVPIAGSSGSGDPVPTAGKWGSYRYRVPEKPIVTVTADFPTAG